MKRRAAHRVFCVVALSAPMGCGLASSDIEHADAGTPALEGSVVDSETRVTLERTACYGSCPVYSLSIGGDGRVDYFGRSFVKIKGAASKQVAVSDVQGLVDQMLRADYFELSQHAPCAEGFATDFPGATTSLTLGSRTHTVQHYHGNPCAPAELHVLEDAIDAVAGSAEWLKCDTPDGACCDPAAGNPLIYPCNR